MATENAIKGVGDGVEIHIGQNKIVKFYSTTTVRAAAEAIRIEYAIQGGAIKDVNGFNVDLDTPLSDLTGTLRFVNAFLPGELLASVCERNIYSPAVRHSPLSCHVMSAPHHVCCFRHYSSLSLFPFALFTPSVLLSFLISAL